MYYENVSDLISLNRKNLIKDGLTNAFVDLIILVIIYYFTDIFAIVFFNILLFTILPKPYVVAPQEYKINENTIFFGKKKLEINEISYKINKKNKYVSINKPWRGEVVRLYSNNVEKILELLNI